LKIDPIYPRAQGAAPVAGRPAAAPWQIMQRADHPDARQANAQALHDLENGATGLTLVFAGANGAYGFGLEPSAEAVAQILDGIYLDAGIGIELQIGPQSRMAAIHVAEYIQRRGIDSAACDIRFGLDPLGACAVWGSSPYSWSEIVPAVTSATRASRSASGPLAAADGRVIHDTSGRKSRAGVFAGHGRCLFAAIEALAAAAEDAQGVYARRPPMWINS
jgi:methylmalonyl-CoA mutase